MTDDTSSGSATPPAPSSGEPPDAPTGAAQAFAAAHAGDDWRMGLSRAEKSGAVHPTLRNAVTILRNDPKWAGVIALDEFSGRVMKRRPPPFAIAERGEWGDLDDTRLMLWLSQEYYMEPKKQVIMDAVHLVADANRFHEVRDYLRSLKWDGKTRLAYWLAAYLGAEQKPEEKDTPPLQTYVGAAGTKWMVAAVARIMRPGCKADNVLILEGDQGLGKSTAFAVLAGADWFTDAPFKIGDKEGYQLIQGKWIVELAELDSFNKAETSGSKLFFSQYVDRFRVPWGKRPADVPRQCVFGGSVNHDTYLKDDSGNRRYWPVRVTKIDIPELRADRDQLWAEAVALFDSGMRWDVLPEERAMFEIEQEARYVGDAWETQILKYLDTSDNAGVKPQRVTTADVLRLGLHLDASRWTRAEQQRVGNIMRRLGWPRKRSRKIEGRSQEWYYQRPGSTEDAE
jgi:putative DNA primase/helicase